MKRCEWAIEAFRDLPDSKLTIYGNLPVGYTEENLPDNVHFKGFVENVPYENHEGLCLLFYERMFCKCCC